MESNPGARVRLVGFALLVATFVAGGLAGAAVNQVRGDPATVREDESRDRCRERRDPHAYLQLTPEQQARVDAVLERRQKEIAAFWDENGQQMEMIVDSARAEFRNILTEQQRAEFDGRRAAERERRKQRERECDEARRDSTKEETR